MRTLARLWRWLDRRATRYLLVGGTCAAVNNVILIGGDRLGLHYVLLSALTWLVGGALGYTLNARFTFGAPWRWAGFVQFMAGTALGAGVSTLLLALFVGLLRWPMLVAAPLTTVLMILYNYANAHLAIHWRRG